MELRLFLGGAGFGLGFEEGFVGGEVEVGGDVVEDGAGAKLGGGRWCGRWGGYGPLGACGVERLLGALGDEEAGEEVGHFGDESFAECV